ncbi:sporulation-delaying protein SdpB family protein [Bacillus subtilis]|uniref:sporulation-delaying protein SdpB family protein n=1 Tax=Bacillus TaxID=1386 RepID=UPI00063FEFF7|nr:sporulation-delaying protein SdpB family protein [Bacillus subtilis]AKI93537.1 sporulation protein [Bacillus subtilis]MBE1866728.1 HTTM domain-containing protein [Bacillus subtilis]MDX7993943.1 HTTM domain-containing protein [Bacillus subtilis]NUC07930.1 HTTM domain-containing protein [Bacillus subtilis]
MKILNSFESYIDTYNPWKNTYALSRSLLGFSTLLVLLFNSADILFSYSANNVTCENVYIPTAFCFANKYSISFEVIRYLMIFILALVVIGWRPRYTGFFHWYICYSIQTSALTIDGGEQIATVLSFLLIPVTLLDSRQNHWKIKDINYDSFTKKIVLFYLVTIIKIQVFVIYLNAALERLKNKEWAEGTAIYYFFSDPVFGLPDYQLNLLNPLLESNYIVVFTWLVTIFELFLAASIISNIRIKRIALILGIIFHIGIIISIGIVSFGLIMISALIIYLHPIQKNINMNWCSPLFKYISQKGKRNFKRLGGESVKFLTKLFHNI